MIIRESDILSTKEMISFLGVSKDQWKRNKDKLLLHFGKFFEYEVLYQGRNINYHIIKELKPYEKFTKEKKSIQRERIYEKNIIEVISEDNIQTAKNVSRIIKNKAEIQAYNHKESTMYEYTRVKMRTMFGVKVNQGGTRGQIERKVWCRLHLDQNFYEEMSQEDIEKFYEIFRSAKEDIKEEELEVFSDYQNGLINQEEMNKQIGDFGFLCFQFARKEFAQKYGYFPIKVPVYEISAFESEINYE